MTVRRFKPGDRVQKRGDGQLMTVQKYCLKHHPFFGTYLSENEVECTWYENGKSRRGIFDQRTLVKASASPWAMGNSTSLDRNTKRT